MKRQKHLFTLATFFVCVGLLTMGASHAYAFTSKLYPGSMCVKWGGGTPVYSWGSIGNASSTTTLYLDCPGINSSASLSSGWMHVTDQHYSLNIKCTLESVYRSGSSLFHWSSGPKFSVGSSPNVQDLLFTFGQPGANWASHYYFSCSIPPTYSGYVSYIHTYRMDED